jgi:hypothetical protein
MQFELLLEPSGEPRKSPVEFFELGRLAQLLAQEELAIDQLERGFARLLQARMKCQIRLRRDPLAGAPAPDLVVAQPVNELLLAPRGRAREFGGHTAKPSQRVGPGFADERIPIKFLIINRRQAFLDAITHGFAALSPEQ